MTNFREMNTASVVQYFKMIQKVKTIPKRVIQKRILEISQIRDLQGKLEEEKTSICKKDN